MRAIREGGAMSSDIANGAGLENDGSRSVKKRGRNRGGCGGISATNGGGL